MGNKSKTQTGGRPATTSVIAGQYALSVGKPDVAPPVGWEWVLLTDVARLETGHTPSRKHPEYWDGDVSWIGIKDATDNHGRIIYDTYQHTNELGIENSSARLLPANTVCLTRTASVGYVVVMGKPMATSQDFVNWVCSDAIDHRFLKYVLLAESESFLRFASGTTHQTIYFPEVKAFHVCLPPLPEQRAIAEILGSLDDKIEANRRQNETLEATARAIFQSWFVDFDPVHAKARGETPLGMDAETTALFPDSFEESALGLIPRGWGVGTISDLADMDRISINPGNFSEEMFWHYSLPAYDEGRMPKLEYGWEIKSNKYRLPDGCVLLSKLNPQNMKVWLPMPYDDYSAIASTEFLVMMAQNYFSREYIYSLFTTDSFARIFSNLVTGTSSSHQRVKPAYLMGIDAILPPQLLVELFTAITRPFYQVVLNNQDESRALAETRDALLPRLVSGELRVGEVEK